MERKRWRLTAPFSGRIACKLSGRTGDIPRLQPAWNSPLETCPNLRFGAQASCNIRLRSLLRLRCPFCQADRIRLSGPKGDIPRLQPARNSPLKHCSNLEALRIFPSFSWSGNAAAGSAASRCTESALSRRACELRKASCNTHCVRSYTCGFAVLSAERIAVGSPGRKATFASAYSYGFACAVLSAERIAVGSPGRMASTVALQCVAVYCAIWHAAEWSTADATSCAAGQ